MTKTSHVHEPIFYWYCYVNIVGEHKKALSKIPRAKELLINM